MATLLVAQTFYYNQQEWWTCCHWPLQCQNHPLSSSVPTELNWYYWETDVAALSGGEGSYLLQAGEKQTLCLKQRQLSTHPSPSFPVFLKFFSLFWCSFLFCAFILSSSPSFTLLLHLSSLKPYFLPTPELKMGKEKDILRRRHEQKICLLLNQKLVFPCVGYKKIWVFKNTLTISSLNKQIWDTRVERVCLETMPNLYHSSLVLFFPCSFPLSQDFCLKTTIWVSGAHLFLLLTPQWGHNSNINTICTIINCFSWHKNKITNLLKN